jgi:hypothetical protein
MRTAFLVHGGHPDKLLGCGTGPGGHPEGADAGAGKRTGKSSPRKTGDQEAGISNLTMLGRGPAQVAGTWEITGKT